MARHRVLETLKHFLHPEAKAPGITPRDRQFLDSFRAIVEEHRSDPGFTTTTAATTLRISRMHLNRKLRALTGHSTREYIRLLRLEGARALLSQPLPIAFIAQSFGFRSLSNFAKAFRKRFGVTPSSFRARASLARQPTPPKRC